MQRLITILAIMILPYYAITQNIVPRQIEAFNELYNSAGGENWHYKTIKDLLKRKESPYIEKYKNLVGYNGTGYFRLEIIDLTNNNLTGEIPDVFAYNPKAKTGWKLLMEQKGVIKFSYNNIKKVSKYLGLAKGGNYYKELWLDNNNISEINFYNKKVNNNGNSWVSTIKFCIHQNELTSLNMDRLGSVNLSSRAIVGRNTTLCRIDNNRLNFNDILKIKKSVESLKAGAIGGAIGSEWEYIYAPQKAIGGNATEETKSAGESIALNFSLPESGNEYTWLLNGKPVNIDGKNCVVNNFDELQAGVYTCKVTNKKLTDLTLYSYDMAIWFKKPGNKAPTNISITNTKANNKMPLYTNIAQFTGVDPDKDKLYFRLDDKKANNSSFRIVNGNTLIVADKLFSQAFIKNYTIVVEAYDCFGGKFEKEFTIEKGDVTTQIPYPSAVLLSNTYLNENTIGEIGEFNLEGVNDGDYSLSLTKELDNEFFTLKNNKLKNKINFDFETKALYNIQLKCTSSDKKISFTKDFSIHVNDINDAPDDIFLVGNGVLLGAPLFSNIGILQASDQDISKQKFVYTLLDDNGVSDNKYFRICDNKLLTAKNFTSEDLGSKVINIQVADNSGARYTKAFSISIKEGNSKNESPRGLGLTNTVISSKNKVNDVIAQIFMNDPEGEKGSFSCENKYVSIKGNNLILKTKPKAGTSFELLIKASDGVNKIEQTIIIYASKNINGIEIAK